MYKVDEFKKLNKEIDKHYEVIFALRKRTVEIETVVINEIILEMKEKFPDIKIWYEYFDSTHVIYHDDFNMQIKKDEKFTDFVNDAMKKFGVYGHHLCITYKSLK